MGHYLWLKIISAEANRFLKNNETVHIIFNYIFELTFESSFSKSTLERKSEYIVENNVYHLVISKNVFASVDIIYNISP